MSKHLKGCFLMQKRVHCLRKKLEIHMSICTTLFLILATRTLVSQLVENINQLGGLSMDEKASLRLWPGQCGHGLMHKVVLELRSIR